MLILGTLVYNKVLNLPFWGFNLFTRAAREKAEAEKMKQEEEQEVKEEKNNSD